MNICRDVSLATGQNVEWRLQWTTGALSRALYENVVRVQVGEIFETVSRIVYTASISVTSKQREYIALSAYSVYTHL